MPLKNLNALKSITTYGESDCGSLSIVEGLIDIPFEIRRIYYITGVGKNKRRGFHAHKTLQQLMVCLNGTVKILLDDGKQKEIIELNEPSLGLYIQPGLWREMFDFSPGSVLLVLASEHYDETDYIRDYPEFLAWKGITE